MKRESLSLTDIAGVVVTIGGVDYTALVNERRNELLVKPIVTINVGDVVDCKAKDILGRVTGVMLNKDDSAWVTYRAMPK